MWCDAHNHLHDARFPESAAERIALMRANGVERCVVNGTCEQDWDSVAALAEEFPDFVLPAFGLHPWKVGSSSPGWIDRLECLLDRFPHASIGECGVDRWVESPPIEEQIPCFRAQWRLALERSLPISVHCLKAWGPLLTVLNEEGDQPRGFLLHSFGGSVEMVDQLVPRGAFFSFSGYFLQARKAAVVEAFRRVPEDRLFLETDAPDMRLPEELHPLDEETADHKRLNHPANLRLVGEELARRFGVGAEELARRTRTNFRRYFLNEA